MQIVIGLLSFLLCSFTGLPAIAATPTREATDADKRTLLAAAEAGDSATIKALLDKGAPVDTVLTPDNDTALMRAASAGHAEACRTLLLSGADPSRENKQRRSPVVAAVEGNYPAVLEILLARGGKPMGTLVAPAELTAYGTRFSLLAHAVYRGSDAVADLLLRYGAPVNTPPRYRMIAPLQAALIANRTGLVDRLIRNGAIVGQDILDYARKKPVAKDLVDILERNSAAMPSRLIEQKNRIQELSQNGLRALADNRLQDALRLFEKGRAIIADAPGFERELGYTYERLGDEARAYDFLARYLELRPWPHKAVEARKHLAATDRGKAALTSAFPPPWVVRYQCSGDDAAECERQCTGGHAGSCRTIGQMYRGIGGFPVDMKKAEKCLKDACAWGNGEACGAVGDILSLSFDNRAHEAPPFYEDGCALLDGVSCVRKGGLILEGKVQPSPGTDRVASVRALYAGLCELDSGEACTALGYMEYQGVGGPVNIDRALQQLDRGCDKGVSAACKYLAIIFTEDNGVAPNPAKAAGYTIRACDYGDRGPCVEAGKLLCAGAVVPRDIKRGKELLDSACKIGNLTACKLAKDCH